jgi:hypothetical protein
MAMASDSPSPRRLESIALLASTLGLATLALSTFIPEVRIAMAMPLAEAEGVVAVLLFLRMLFDRRIGAGVNTASRELQRDMSGSRRMALLLDRRWGLLGNRTGTTATRWIRLVAMVAFVGALILCDRTHTDLLLLSGASFAVAILVGLLHVGSTTTPDPFG